jgi:hypothetical protein
VSGRGAAPGTSQFWPTSVIPEGLAVETLPALLLNGCWSGTAASRYGRDPLSLAVGSLHGGADTVIAGMGLTGA